MSTPEKERLEPGLDFTRILEVVRSPQARPLLREAAWAAGICVALIVVSAVLLPRIAYTVYLTVGVFFAATLTGVFVSLVENETGDRLLRSPLLRRWLAGFALVVSFLAAIILV